MNIVHIASRLLWEEARQLGRYSPPGLASEGFIHCSTVAQVTAVAGKYYRGQSGLVLLVIDPARLTSTLRWEPPAEGAHPPGVPSGDLFPHIYGSLNLDAIVQVLDLEPDAAGGFSLPAGLRTGA